MLSSVPCLARHASDTYDLKLILTAIQEFNDWGHMHTLAAALEMCGRVSLEARTSPSRFSKSTRSPTSRRFCGCATHFLTLGARRLDIVQEFSREVALWGQLSHRNVLPFWGVYHLGESNSQVCLVSPWMENGTIVQYLQNAPNAPRVLLVSAFLLVYWRGYSYNKSRR